jgi:flagellar L-ring protein precursor FlgH
MKFVKSFLILLALIHLSGCSSIAQKWKSLISGGDSDSAKSSSNSKEGGAGVNPASFNKDPNYGNPKERQYKRITKSNFSEEQQLEENAGSLWKREGQGSFLFSQNNLRVLGDVVNVEVEGKVADNLNIKVDLIKKNQIKMEQMAARPVAAAAQNGKLPRPGEKTERSVAAAQPAPAAPAAGSGNAQGAPGADGHSKDQFKFDSVPCRIVDKNVDGSYRVKGMQTVYIGKKEYKLIVTGNIRSDDLSMDKVMASKVMDSKFDLVATNKDI